LTAQELRKRLFHRHQAARESDIKNPGEADLMDAALLAAISPPLGIA